MAKQERLTAVQAGVIALLQLGYDIRQTGYRYEIRSSDTGKFYGYARFVSVRALIRKGMVEKAPTFRITLTEKGRAYNV